MNEKRVPIYYEYLTVNSDSLYHLVRVDSEGFCLLIPSNYNINYSKSVNDYSGIGHIYFHNEKYEFNIDYVKEDLDNDYEQDYDKMFVNYHNQKFYELNSDNIDYISIKKNNYHFKITGNHKLSISEYFDMYRVLFSITFANVCDDSVIHDLEVIDKYGIISYSKGDDILILDLSKYDLDIEKTVISSDDAYLKYKAKEKKIDILSSNLISNVSEDMLFFKYDNGNWLLNGNFNFDILGNYTNGYIDEIDEIISSDELELSEKNNMLNVILMQKQNEISQYEDVIVSSFIEYIVSYLKDNITYELWDKYHIRDFIYLDKLSDNYDSLNDNEIYELFRNKISEEILNIKTIKDSTEGEKIIIKPNSYIVTLSTMNYLISSTELIVNEEYNVI